MMGDTMDTQKLKHILAEIEDTRSVLKDTKENFNDLKMRMTSFGIWLKTLDSNLEHILKLTRESIPQPELRLIKDTKADK